MQNAKYACTFAITMWVRTCLRKSSHLGKTPAIGKWGQSHFLSFRKGLNFVVSYIFPGICRTRESYIHTCYPFAKEIQIPSNGGKVLA